MKKSLLATTALAALGAVAVATPASAKFEVSVNGYMEQWFGYSDSAKSANDNSDQFVQHSDNEVHVNFAQTLDNGIKIGGRIEFEGEVTAVVDEQYVYLDGSFGRIVVGSENTAAYLMHYGVTSNGVGIDESDGSSMVAGGTGNLQRTSLATAVQSDQNTVTYFSPRINGFQVGASYTPTLAAADTTVAPVGEERDGTRDNAWAVAGNYNTSINDISIAASVGYADGGGDDLVLGDENALAAGLRLGFGGFSASLAYGEHEDDAAAVDENNFGFSLGYKAGPAGVSLGYIRGEDSDNNDQQDLIEIGASYAVGPGVKAVGSMYYLERTTGANTVADGIAVVGGLRMNF
jgi:outer membrane protein OmpU